MSVRDFSVACASSKESDPIVWRSRGECDVVADNERECIIQSQIVGRGKNGVVFSSIPLGLEPDPWKPDLCDVGMEVKGQSIQRFGRVREASRMIGTEKNENKLK